MNVKRHLSFLLAVLMIFCSLSLPVSAAEEAPVVYLSMSEGSDSNSGITAAKPVKTITQAFAVLAETGNGGIVVLMDGVNTRTANSTAANLLTLPDAGGHVTITSKFGNTDYRATNNARLMLYDGLAFQNDVTFDNVTFLRVAATANRGIYMRYNDLTVTSTCNTYTYSGSNYSVGQCPPANKAVTTGYQVIVTGYNASTSDISFETQSINILGGAFGRILVGNKTFAKETETDPTSKGGAVSGTVFINVAENAILTNYIHAKQEYASIETFVNSTNESLDIRFDDDVDRSAHVSVSADSSFEHYGMSLRQDNEGPAVGISGGVDVDWVDTKSISEFGYIFSLSNGLSFSALSENAKRSVAYSQAKETLNYQYAAGDDIASFRGVLVYDGEDAASLHLHTVITAYPYAVADSSDFVYVGAKIDFTLAEICEMILESDTVSPEDKAIADEILTSATSFYIRRFAAEPVPSAKESTVVYASQSGGGSGLTADSPVTFEEALGMTKNVVADTVVIVVTDAITLDPASTIDPDRNDTDAESSDFTYYFPANKSKVIITSYYDGVNYKQKYNASLTLTSETSFYGDYTIENTALINTADIKICMQYNDITLGTGLTCTKSGSATKYIDLVSGYHAGHSAFNTSEKVSCREDAKIEILSGTWNGFTGGNVTQNGRSVFGNVYADATVVIDIGSNSGAPRFESTDRDYFAVSGQNDVEGTVCVNVNNATFTATNPLLLSRYLMIYDTMMQDYHPTVNGHIILNIKGGSFSTNVITAVPNKDNYNYVSSVGPNAKFSINVLGGTFKRSGLYETTELTVNGYNATNSELYLDGYTATKSKITTVSAATPAPELDYTKKTYDAPPVYDKVIEEGVYDPSKLSSNALAELKSDLPPSDEALSHLNTVIGYFKNTNKDKTARPSMMKLNDAEYNLTGVSDVEFITMLSGEYSINKTFTNYNIGATGGGYMIDCGDHVLVFFGDTEGEGEGQKNNTDYGGPWRANVLAFTDDDDYTDGILLDGFYLSDQGVYDGFATEFLKSSHSNGVEMSKIPTGGIMIGDTLYVTYMSVRRWSKDGEDGIWKCNYGGLAISRDMGRTWETPSDLRWSEASEFSQLYPVLDGEWVYIFGQPGGRRGGSKLMRVPAAEIENIAAYQYCVGYDANGKAIFEAGKEGLDNSTLIIEGGMGGVGIMYNEYLGEWVMMYASSNTGDYTESGIYMRVANSLNGEWSDPVLVISQSAGFGAVYEPRICAKYQNAETGEMMLITSNWGIYNSMVFNVKLERRGEPVVQIIN